ncbi:MAG: hypothetical protein WBL20_08280 [Sphingobium sp.]|uniref:hypothetical protein n=1 Tax=Sphingobium sp. TaxID=1912891 RepID=UPI003BAF04C5
MSDRLRCRLTVVGKDADGRKATALFCREEAARRRAWLGLDKEAEQGASNSGGQRARH